MEHRERYEYLKKKKEKELAKEQKIEGRSKTENVVREVLGWGVYILIVIAATYLIVTYVGQRTMVSGDSMEATLQDGDNLIVDKLSYRLRDPERFEIVVFPYKHKEDTYYIKRIIGLPGESVQVKDGYVYINGELLEENYGLEAMNNAGIADEPIVLGEDEYFVLGDNRNRSSDSRDPSVGILTREDLMGRAWLRIWPLESIGVIPHD